MRIIEKVLKSKLTQMGYDLNNLEEKLSQIDFDIIDKQVAFENEAENFISIKEYDKPNVDIARVLVNFGKHYLQSIIVDGEINLATSSTSIGTTLPTVDYKLDDNICIVTTTVNLTIEIIRYIPSQETIFQYKNKTYEDTFKAERNNIAKEYYDAFVENGRVNEAKVKAILSLLLSEYIIDELAVTGENPKIKMYDNPDSYAENITEYKLKYINRKTNRIELAHKIAPIKMLGANVSAGVVSNDPYIKLNQLSSGANFPLNMISCYWTNALGRKREEVSIYIATRQFGNATTYKEYKEDVAGKYEELVNSLTLQFQRDVAGNINQNCVLEVLKRLNPELIAPSMSIIRDCMENPSDPIEAIRYKFKAISEPSEFEEKLYVSIEDNIGKRYKYKLTESVLEDFTRVGNKLAYTSEDGTSVNKQSIADFNVNSSTAIIRRETLIDSSKIPGLLGYIYEDVEYIGTDMLPVPSIEVDFYFPQVESYTLNMYNGTNFETDFEKFANANKFNAKSSDEIEISTMKGTAFATVKYVNSKGEILKENRIANLFPGTSYVPEVIPIINDVEGKEWVCADTQYPSIIINAVSDYNVVEIKYTEKFARVNVTYLNREGKKIRDNSFETVQVGSIYDLSKKDSFTDESLNDWKLVTARPQKLLVKENDNQNSIILVYDLEKESVTINFVKPNGESIIEPKISDVQIGKIFEFKPSKVLLDSAGLGWEYIGKEKITLKVEQNKENQITISYNEYKLPVTVKSQNEDGIEIANDVVEYLQVGTKFKPEYDESLYDVNYKKWQFKSISTSEITVSKDERQNVIKVIYEPMCAKVWIQLINLEGKKIMNPIQKMCQIGEEFSSVYMEEVTDNYGKMWKVDTAPESLVVCENESENTIDVKYKPLISKITVKFFDDERNELIPAKVYEQQAGTTFKPEVIEKLESTDGRKWHFNKEKVSEIVVKKNAEENIVSVFYAKEMAKVKLQFMDIYGKVLRDETIVDSQIGGVFDERAFNKITDRDGGKWMIDNTEPKKLIVKASDNIFKLYYGEVKAIVVVKHVDVNTNKCIIDDVVAKVKLGGVFIPNIQTKILDTNKYHWKFVGDKNLSIVVNENEQQNIVILQYDEIKAKVTVKYQDSNKASLRNDVVYDLQIGKQYDYKKLDKFIDSNGLGWNFTSTKSAFEKVEENNNEIINYYEPLKANVITKYLNDKENELVEESKESIQVGKTFKPAYEEKLRDGENKLWKFENISNQEVKVAENGNTINVKYLPVISKVTERFLRKTGEVIGEPKVKEIQVGTTIEVTSEEIFTDNNGLKWNLIKIDNSSLVVSENVEENIINRFYEPRMKEVTAQITDDSGNELMTPKKYLAQVGSKYKPELPLTYIDNKTKLGWRIPEKANDIINVNEDVSKNVLKVKYEKYLVKVTTRSSDENGNVLLPDKFDMLQVGTEFEPKFENNIVDKDGKHWFYNLKVEGLLMTTAKKVSIEVSEKAEKNIAVLKYQPLLASVTIKYQNNLGATIAANQEVKAQVGSEYTPEIKDVIMDNKKKKWTFNPNSKATIKVDKNVLKNVILLSYEEEKASIMYKYQDEFNNRLKTPKKVLAQIGSVYKPEVENVIEDEQGKVWEYKSASVDKLEVQDNSQGNVIVVTYVPLLVDVKLVFKNMQGNLITQTKEKAQFGSKFKPNLDESIYDKDSKMYKFKKCVPEELLIKEQPIGVEEEINVFELSYEPVYSNISIIYQDIDGNKLRDDDILQLQVGTKYTPKLVQFVNDKKGIQWENISKEVDTIRVRENAKENVIKMTFEIAKAEVLVRYRDIVGNAIKESEHIQQNIGVEFVPKIEDIILDGKNRKWIFTNAEPEKLTVGSINNIINLVYQEKKTPVTIKYETTDGKKLRSDVVLNIQEGVEYIPKKNYPVIYDENEVWRYLEFRPASLLVTDQKAENVIVQVYTNNKVVEEQKEKFVNPFANTATEEELEAVNRMEERKMEALRQEEKVVSSVEFKEPNLVELSKVVLLSDKEKVAVIKLNDINKKIISLLNDFRKAFDFNNQDALIREIDMCMQEEKEIIKNEMESTLSSDKTGKKFMRILESIVKGEVGYQKLQDKKAILLADYFINNDNSTLEQATYICERGKNDKELLVMREKINNVRKGKEELQDIYVTLLYEKAMLNNYYKTRTKAKDDYFIDEGAKDSVGTEIVIMITNILPKQAFNLLTKNLNAMQTNELDAIINLLTAQQKSSLEKMINEIRDNRLRKETFKKYKNIR